MLGTTENITLITENLVVTYIWKKRKKKEKKKRRRRRRDNVKCYLQYCY
jgi:hypothetical protein